MEQLGRTTLPWQKWLEDLDTEELRALAAQADQLATHPAWQWIQAAAAKWADSLIDALLPPTTPEQARYVSVMSQVFGMRVVTDCPDAIRLIAQRREETERKAAETAARRQEQR